MSRDPNCWCGETTLDPWCPVHDPERHAQPQMCPDTEVVCDPNNGRHCPTCHSDNMWAHGRPCYYCGGAIDNLAANPNVWNVFLCHADDVGVIKPHHIGCVAKRLAYLEEICDHVQEISKGVEAGPCLPVETHWDRSAKSWRRNE